MIPIALPNNPIYKDRMKVCVQCEHKLDRVALGIIITVCGVCKCPIKTKCVTGPCPKGKW